MDGNFDGVLRVTTLDAVAVHGMMSGVAMLEQIITDPLSEAVEAIISFAYTVYAVHVSTERQPRRKNGCGIKLQATAVQFQKRFLMCWHCLPLNSMIILSSHDHQINCHL